MPIITPVYPQQNSTFNVIQSSQTIIQREFARGLSIADKVLRGSESWSPVFDRVDFFNAYRDYLVVSAVSRSNRLDHLSWVGFIESKLRHLASSIERVPFVSLAHVYPPQFSCRERIE